MSVDKFEQKLREKFEGVSIPPSPELWGNIESRIPQKDKKRGVIWLWAGGISIAASLAVWLWLSNVNLQTPLEIESGMSQVEESNNMSEEKLEQIESPNRVLEDFTDDLVSNSTTGVKPSETRSGTKPSFVERTSDRRVEDERSAAQNTQTSATPNKNLNQVPSKAYAIRAIDHSIADWRLADFYLEKLISGEIPSLSGLETNWWEELEELPLAEESVPRWAINIQAGQDLIGDVNPSLGKTEADPPQTFSNEFASNDDLLGLADHVQFARNPNPVFSQDGVDQATLISYPTQESRFKLVGEYNLEGNWSIRSGLGLGISNQGGLTQANVVYNSTASPGADFDGEWSYNDGPSLQNIQLEVPITLQYKIARPKGAIVLGSGFSFNRNLNNLSQARYFRANQDYSTSLRTVFSFSDQANTLFAQTGENNSQSIGYRSWNNFVLLQAQYERPISPRMALFGGPSFKYMLNDIFVGSLASQQAPFRVGLTAGLRFGR
ncbi:MAG: hypothetical protein AAF927_25460 [Bacteroidota bacterium]